MPDYGEIKTLYKDKSKTQAIYPRTVASAVSISEETDLQQALDGKLSPADVVNNVTTTTTDKPLSANMGKTLQDEINNLKGIGRFLALWDCTTGLPTSEPTSLPYAYRTGDYYRISRVAEGSEGFNYRPVGSSYTGVASTVIEPEDVTADWVYYFDGTNWLTQASGTGSRTLDPLGFYRLFFNGAIDYIGADALWTSRNVKPFDNRT